LVTVNSHRRQRSRTQSAGAAIAQLQSALASDVTYLDGAALLVAPHVAGEGS